MVDLLYGNEEVCKMNVKKAFVKGFALVAVIASLVGCGSVSSLGGSPDLAGTWYQYQPGSSDGNGYRSGTIYKITLEKVSDHTYKMVESKYYQKGFKEEHKFLNKEEYFKNYEGYGFVYSASNGASHSIKEDGGKLTLVSEGGKMLHKGDDSFFEEAFKQEEELIRKSIKEDNEKNPKLTYEIRNISFTKKDL